MPANVLASLGWDATTHTHTQPISCKLESLVTGRKLMEEHVRHATFKLHVHIRAVSQVVALDPWSAACGLEAARRNGEEVVYGAIGAERGMPPRSCRDHKGCEPSASTSGPQGTMGWFLFAYVLNTPAKALLTTSVRGGSGGVYSQWSSAKRSTKFIPARISEQQDDFWLQPPAQPLSRCPRQRKAISLCVIQYTKEHEHVVQHAVSSSFSRRWRRWVRQARSRKLLARGTPRTQLDCALGRRCARGSAL